MLDDTLKAQLRAYLQRVTRPVEIAASLDDTAASAQLRALLADVAAACALVTVTETRRAASDAFVLRQRAEVHGRGPGSPDCRWGTSSLPGAGAAAGRRAPAQGGRRRCCAASATSRGDFEFDVYVSLGCHNCPDVVQALNLMALQNPRIRATMIDGALFQDEVGKRQVMAVPTVFLNGTRFGQGRMTLEEIVRKVDTGAARTRSSEAGGPGAVTTCWSSAEVPQAPRRPCTQRARACARASAAERFGGQVLDTLGIENYISVKETARPPVRAGAGGSRAPVRRRHHGPATREIARRVAAAGRSPAGGRRVPQGAHASSSRTGARWRNDQAFPASRNTATRAWPTAPIATDRCSRASASR